jgi:hypothetical protein
MGRTCRTQGRQERFILGVGGEGKNPIGRPRIILKWFFNEWDGGHELD